MAKDVITRFKLETTGFDSKIKQAAKDLSAYSKTATQAKEGFNQFTKANIDAAKALGTIATSTTNAKDRAKELVGAFNDAAKAYNSLTKEQQQSDWAKALAGSLTQLQQRIKETKQEMQGLGDSMKGGSGGIFSGMGSKMEGALAVFGGNLMTKAAGAVAQFGSEMADMVKQGVEMAKAGEGIRIAFERLGRGDILDGLREATHGTVTDLELMKAAVKFNDFKLPLDELGTMLAFAQQKAKDTGQSVDYMVDSIVTGLGRKSLMILDNLGLSATEVKDKMKETGDMTKAVGAIIREQMSKAGDYVETAADRAAQANVSLQNKMEELGRKFAPVEEASSQLWTSMKIAILDIVGGPLARLLNGLTEAGRLKNALNDINGDGGETRSSRRLRILREYSGSQAGVTKQTVYDRQIARYAAEEEKEWRKVNELTRQRQNILKELGNIDPRKDEKGVQANFLNTQANSLLSQINDAKNHAKAIQLSRQEYEKGAKQLLNPSTSPSSDTTTPTTTTTKGKTEVQAVSGSIDEQTKKVQDLQKAWRAAADDDSRQKIKDEIEEQQYLLDRMTGKDKFDPTKMGPIADLTGLVPVPDFDVYMKRRKNSRKSYDAMAPVAPESINIGFITPLKALEDQLKALTEAQALFGGISEKTWQDYQKQIDEVNKKITVFKNGGVDTADKTAGSWRDAASAISQVGVSLQQIQDPSAKIAGIVGQAIASIALGFGQATAKDSKLGVLGWIAAITGGLATMVTTISAIHSATGYAQGGEVKGTTYSNDQIPAFLNAGEIVLTRAMAGNLAAQLQGSGIQNLRLSATVSGEQIRLVLNNNGRRTGRGEYITTNFR